MISSDTTLVPTKAISLGERQRKTISPYDLGELALSIAQNGLIHNIVVERDSLALVAGERRLKAFQFLAARGDNCRFPEYENWTRIPARLASDLRQNELEVLELEENIKRSDLTWQEESEAVVRLHTLKQELDPNWLAADTARLLSIDTGNMSRYLSVGRAIASGDEVIIKSTSMRNAANKMSRRVARAIDSEIGILEEVDREEKGVVKSDRVVFCDDFTKWASSYSGPKFNFIHCDFPYGVGMDKSEQGGTSGLAAYEDDEETYFKLLDTLLMNWDRIMLPSSHIMFWFSMNFFGMTRDSFLAKHIYINPFPLIWHKSDNKGILPDPTRGPRRIYETCFFGATGDRQIVSAVSNLYSAPCTKEIHLSEKPESVLRHFMRMFVDGNSSVLDPTCGSGSALRAANALGAKSVLGLELNPDYALQAETAFQKAKTLLEVSK